MEQFKHYLQIARNNLQHRYLKFIQLKELNSDIQSTIQSISIALFHTLGSHHNTLNLQKNS